MNRLIIIPDIHGRTFWQDAVKKSSDTPIVFLGDYLDPYAHEGISEAQAWDNFMAIVAYKKANPDKVQLLLGNHDLGYIDRLINSCRRDWANAARNRDFFTTNLELFDLAYETQIGDNRYLLSHAGVNRKWAEYQFGKGTPISAELFNSMLHGNDFGKLMRALRNVSEWRGGDWPFGSIVWADIREFTEEGTDTPGLIQIVGHTMLDNGPVTVGGGALICIDCKRAFALTDEGQLEVY